MNISIHLNDKKKTDTRQEVLNARRKIMKINIHVYFHRSCATVIFCEVCKNVPKKVELHRSLKNNCDHSITLRLFINILTNSISTVYFAEESV